MTESTSKSDKDVSPESSPDSGKASPAPTNDVEDAPSTPTKNSSNSKGTPKSAPAATGGGSGTKTRTRANSRKAVEPPPTLLADFLRGRPSPARLAAERQRRQSVEAVKAELRHEMKQGQVKKIQPPGGVRDRVKAWQKVNAKALDDADPDDAATEPTDVAFNGEEIESVTEEDRIRIKMRQKKKNNGLKAKPSPSPQPEDTASSSTEKEPAKSPPKKRVVSDDNWVKPKNRRSSARRVSPRITKRSPSGSGVRIPKDFTLQTANPHVDTKIKSWANKVEAPTSPHAPSYLSFVSLAARYDEPGSEGTSEVSGHSTARQSLRRKTAGSVSDGSSIRVKPVRKKKLGDELKPTSSYNSKNDDDGIRVSPIDSPRDDRSRSRATSSCGASTSLSASTQVTRRRSKTLPSSHSSESRDEEIVVTEEPSYRSRSSRLTEAQRKRLPKEEQDERVIEVIEDSDSAFDTPVKRKTSRSQSSMREWSKGHYRGVSKTRSDKSWLEDNPSTVETTVKGESELSSSIANKSIADIPGDIPFGQSAFSELDLPLNGGTMRTRPKRTKVERNTSLKSMPGVFKKVMEEGKKIIHDINEPPRQPGENKPPSIEKWLNNTVDPFVDSPKADTKSETKLEKQPEKVKEPEKEPSPEPVRESYRGPSREQSCEPSREPETPKTAKSRRKVSHDARSSPSSQPKSPIPHAEQKSTPPQSKKGSVSPSDTPTRSEDPDSAGLKRRRAVRNSVSTPKSTPRKPFFGMLKEAFQGESGGFSKPPISYQSQEERRYDDYDDESEYRTLSGYDEESKLSSAYTGSSYTGTTATSYMYDDTVTGSDISSSHPSSSHPSSSQLSSSQLSSSQLSSSQLSSSQLSSSQLSSSQLSSSQLSSEPPAPKMAGPRLRPPTTGNHELSTILSEEDSSAVDSDIKSDVSHSTVTQSTGLTRDSSLSKTRGQEPGLKRRLTKHSDLVSVLSLPDDRNVPGILTGARSRPSLRKARSSSTSVSIDELLREFSDDEGLYLRELKTLVDGVIPVLLTHVVQSAGSAHLFENDPSAQQGTSDLSKAVVGMGVALEKIRTAHRKASHSDLRRLAHWAHGIVPIYNSYLNSWRLGFHDLVVNLAPAAGVPEDEDSLLNAMPRDANGDVVNSEGERVDVAHLLKRPLIRIKTMVKLVKCINTIMPSEDTQELLNNFERLQEKSRRRHREESARMTDEDAVNTDTTRCRELRTLWALDLVDIDPNLQVSAKDTFSLNLAHSNGQRLECQVELVYRDNQKQPNDLGDLLIRENGDGRRSYLLFPPIPLSLVSARTGDGNFEMVAMVRGTYLGREWFELLTLTSDNEDQILDWLDILPVSPVPPRQPEPSIIDDQDDEPRHRVDIPVGARSIRRKRAPSLAKRRTPSYEERTTTPRREPSWRHRSPPTTPPQGSSPKSDSQRSPRDRTPTQDDYRSREHDPDRSIPLNEDMRPDPLHLQKKPKASSYREDGAPPPPVHRTFSKSSQPDQNNPSTPDSSPIKPPVEFKPDEKLKRRGSSPLKHEYLPSDGGSSQSDRSYTESESEFDSSDDEIDSIDLPETEIGVSIKQDTPSYKNRHDHYEEDIPEEDEYPEALRPVQSLVDESECSLTPSNSASQAGVQSHLKEEDKDTQQFTACISRWSDRGMWKDIADTTCSIIVRPGLIEACAVNVTRGPNDPPLLAMDLTPLVLIRQSTAIDLEIRSSVQSHCQIYKSLGGGNFRFRCQNGPDCFNLYMAVHHARLNNRKFIQLENEARFKSFGERPAPADNDADSSSRQRSWFGRKNSYRSSVRAPTQSLDGASTNASSSVSASSFLKRLTTAGNMTFNLARSSVDKQSRPGSARNSLYASGSSSASGTPPRSPSVSVGDSGQNPTAFNSENIRIRLHLLVSATKWEDFGNCMLQIRRPPPGWRQALRADHGLEKRVTVTSMPKSSNGPPKVLLDAVLGSACFTPMGSRGIVCGIWEEAKGKDGIAGMAPETGPTGGNIKKWCFQCASAGEAGGVLRLVHQEVVRA